MNIDVRRQYSEAALAYGIRPIPNIKGDWNALGQKVSSDGADFHEVGAFESQEHRNILHFITTPKAKDKYPEFVHASLL
jgi:hypothetical protein